MAARKYPWEEWFGRPRTILQRGVHYRCSQSTMCQTVRNNASQRGLRVRLTDTGTEIIIERRAGGGETKYPWDEWFAGKLLLIERSEGHENDKGTIEVPTVKRDYGVPMDAMPPKIKTAARRRYKVVDIYRRDHTGAKLENEGLLIQARDMTADERVAENIKRAEKKAVRAGIGGNEQAHAGG